MKKWSRVKLTWIRSAHRVHRFPSLKIPVLCSNTRKHDSLIRLDTLLFSFRYCCCVLIYMYVCGGGYSPSLLLLSPLFKWYISALALWLGWPLLNGMQSAQIHFFHSIKWLEYNFSSWHRYVRNWAAPKMVMWSAIKRTEIWFVRTHH